MVIAVMAGRRRRRTWAWELNARQALNRSIILEHIRANPADGHHTGTLAAHLRQSPDELEDAITELVRQSYLYEQAVYADHSRSVQLTTAGSDSLFWQAEVRKLLGELS